METKNIEEGREKEHSRDGHLFSGASLVVICFMLLFAGISVVSATVTYDPDTNTIFLESGTNTLASCLLYTSDAADE